MEPISSQRILVIDDEPAMHADFRAVLAGDGLAEADSNLDQLEASMFGQDLRQAREGFEIESAHQGIEGLELARAALAGRRPFTVAFVDMRMPPGGDGLRTVKELWRLDPRLQVVICTAYSDHSWPEMLRELEPQEGLLVVKKPFDPIEIWQAAASLGAHWALARQNEETICGLQRELDACDNMLHQIRASPPRQSA